MWAALSLLGKFMVMLAALSVFLDWLGVEGLRRLGRRSDSARDYLYTQVRYQKTMDRIYATLGPQLSRPRHDRTPWLERVVSGGYLVASVMALGGFCFALYCVTSNKSVPWWAGLTMLSGLLFLLLVLLVDNQAFRLGLWSAGTAARMLEREGRPLKKIAGLFVLAGGVLDFADLVHTVVRR